MLDRNLSSDEWKLADCLLDRGFPVDVEADGLCLGAGCLPDDRTYLLEFCSRVFARSGDAPIAARLRIPAELSQGDAPSSKDTGAFPRDAEDNDVLEFSPRLMIDEDVSNLVRAAKHSCSHASEFRDALQGIRLPQVNPISAPVEVHNRGRAYAG